MIQNRNVWTQMFKERGRKRSPFSGQPKVEQKFTFLRFTFSGGRGAGLTKEHPSIK